MSASAPAVSLCLLVRNEAAHLAETLDSIARQTFGDLEVLIFDNASDDATPEICARFLGDPRFRYYRNAANIGMVANFNRCHAVARGAHVGLLSGNDRLADTYVEKLHALMTADPSIGLATARIDVIDPGSTPLPQPLWVQPAYFETDPEDPVLAGTSVVSHWRYGFYIFGLYRRDVLERLQPLKPLYGADAAFVFELSLYARIRVHPERLFHLRRHDGRQVALVQRLFSEDVLRDVPRNGVFTHFDLMAPFVDQTWAFLETTSYARIAASAKSRLYRAILAIQRGRWHNEIDAEIAAIKAVVPGVLELVRARGDAPTHRAMACRLLSRLGRAAVVASTDPDLAPMMEETARLLRSPPPEASAEAGDAPG